MYLDNQKPSLDLDQEGYSADNFTSCFCEVDSIRGNKRVCRL